jgi:Glycosyltransferase family 87
VDSDYRIKPLLSMTWARITRRKEYVAGVFLLVMTLSHIVLVPRLLPLLRSGYPNFAIFYAAGSMVRHGQSMSLYNLSAQYQVQKQFAPNVRIRQAALPYNHPPFEALLFWPFTFLGYWQAYLFWTALNLTMVMASLVVLRRQFAEIGNLPTTFVVLAATGFFPLFGAIIQGQDCILLLFLYVLAVVTFKKEKDAVTGAILGLGLFRFQLVLPLVLILAVRRWRLLLGFVPVAGLLVLVSLAMLGWRGAVDYVRLVLTLEKTGAGGSIVAVGMPNLRGMIAGLPGVEAGSTLAMALILACSIAAILITVSQIRPSLDSVLFSFNLATIAAILVSYHALTYDLTLLLPAVLLLFSVPWSQTRGTKMEIQADIVLLVLIFLIPRFELLGTSSSHLVWFLLLLGWLYWKLGKGHTPTGDLGRSCEKMIPKAGR